VFGQRAEGLGLVGFQPRPYASKELVEQGAELDHEAIVRGPQQGPVKGEVRVHGHPPGGEFRLVLSIGGLHGFIVGGRRAFGRQRQESDFEELPSDEQLLEIGRGAEHQGLRNLCQQPEIDRGQDRASFGSPDHGPDRLQRSQRFADRAAAHAELSAQVSFGGEPIAHTQILGGDSADQAPQDLLGQRLARGGLEHKNGRERGAGQLVGPIENRF